MPFFPNQKVRLLIPGAKTHGWRADGIFRGGADAVTDTNGRRVLMAAIEVPWLGLNIRMIVPYAWLRAAEGDAE